MNKSGFLTLAILMAIFTMTNNSCKNEAKSETGSKSSGINLEEARKAIEGIDKQFSEDFRNADSVALAAHYAEDGTIGSIKGRENLIAAWGGIIRNAVKNGTPDVIYTTNSIATDGEYLVELGVYKNADIDGTVKSQGKYLVVWKQENDEWKIYRDIGL